MADPNAVHGPELELINGPGALGSVNGVVALLLPDASVLTGGGGLRWESCSGASASHLKLQAYRPPYLFEHTRRTVTLSTE